MILAAQRFRECIPVSLSHVKLQEVLRACTVLLPDHGSRAEATNAIGDTSSDPPRRLIAFTSHVP